MPDVLPEFFLFGRISQKNESDGQHAVPTWPKRFLTPIVPAWPLVRPPGFALQRVGHVNTMFVSSRPETFVQGQRRVKAEALGVHVVEINPLARLSKGLMSGAGKMTMDLARAFSLALSLSSPKGFS